MGRGVTEEVVAVCSACVSYVLLANVTGFDKQVGGGLRRLFLQAQDTQFTRFDCKFVLLCNLSCVFFVLFTDNGMCSVTQLNQRSFTCRLSGVNDICWNYVDVCMKQGT